MEVKMIEDKKSKSKGRGMAHHVEQAVVATIDDLLTNMIAEVSFEVHKSHKDGSLFLDDGDYVDQRKYEQMSVEGLDIFGNGVLKKNHECTCPKCNRTLAASRFAPHLEKCMGMGRNSSRIASRRIQNSTRESNNSNFAMGLSDDDADDDWVMENKKKRKRERSSPRRSRKAKTSDMSMAKFLSSSPSQRHSLLASMCCVVSEHTSKLCTRSMRCPQHSKDQRKQVRDKMSSSNNGTAQAEEAPVLWDAGVLEPQSSSTSPADSTSTVLSHSSSNSSKDNSGK